MTKHYKVDRIDNNARRSAEKSAQKGAAPLQKPACKSAAPLRGAAPKMYVLQRQFFLNSLTAKGGK